MTEEIKTTEETTPIENNIETVGKDENTVEKPEIIKHKLVREINLPNRAYIITGDDNGGEHYEVFYKGKKLNNAYGVIIYGE